MLCFSCCGTCHLRTRIFIIVNFYDTINNVNYKTTQRWYTMSDIKIDINSAEALKFVTDGAGKGDYDSLIFIDVKSSGETTISTNTTATQRSLKTTADSPEEATVAIRAQAIASIADKVDEDQNMSISIKDGKVFISVGSTSATLQDLSDHAIDVRKNITKHAVVNVDDAYMAIESIGRAVRAVSSNNGVVNISGDKMGMAIGSGSEKIYTQELVTATLLGRNEEYRMEINANHLKSINKLSKMDVLDNIEVSEGIGFTLFTFPVNDATTTLGSVSLSAPTVVSARQNKSTPCDNDITPNLSVSKKDINNAIKALKGVIPGNGTVTLDSTQTGRVVIKVNDSDSDGKTVIVDAIVDNGAILSTSLANLQKGLQTVQSSDINIGKIEHNGKDWIAITALDEDDEESLGNNYDLVVAVATEKVES